MPSVKTVASAMAGGRASLVLGSLFAALLLLAACGGDDDGGSAESAFPLGTYQNERTGNEFTFLAEGKYTARINPPDFLSPQVASRWPEGGAPIEGEYEVNGDQIAFHETDVAPEVAGCEPDFVYTWSFDGEALYFGRAVEEDPTCPDRTTDLRSAPWVLQS